MWSFVYSLVCMICSLFALKHVLRSIRLPWTYKNLPSLSICIIKINTSFTSQKLFPSYIFLSWLHFKFLLLKKKLVYKTVVQRMHPWPVKGKQEKLIHLSPLMGCTTYIVSPWVKMNEHKINLIQKGNARLPFCKWQIFKTL